MRQGRGGARRRAPQLPARELGEPTRVTHPAGASVPGRPTERRPGVPRTRAEAQAAGGQEAELHPGSGSREPEPLAPPDSRLALQPSSGERDEARGEPSSPSRPWASAAEPSVAVAPEGPQLAPAPCAAPPWAGRRRVAEVPALRSSVSRRPGGV